MSAELGQIIHNNTVGFPASDFVDALITSLRSEIARVYWNVHQKAFYGAGVGDIGGDTRDWGEPAESAPPLGIPGIEWWPYYNWGGSPEDADWDQEAADRPNFSFEGVEVRWYKRFGRSLNVNVVWPAEKWVRWFERCRQTLRAWEDAHGRLHTGDPTAYPDPAGAVSLTPEPADLRYVKLMEQVDTLNAQINCIACVCIDVAHQKEPTFTPEDWRWCQALKWVVRLGRHALLAPGQLNLHDEEKD